MVGICFMMGEWKIFKASLHSWQRGTNPLFYEVSSILPTPAFSLLLSTPPPPPASLSPPALFPTALSVVLSFLGE